MPSPFPGMNPYIEQPAVWQDFHTRFRSAAAEVIGGQVEPRYFVKIEEHLFVHERFGTERSAFGRPDLSVLPGEELPATSAGGGISAPATVLAALDRQTAVY